MPAPTADDRPSRRRAAPATAGEQDPLDGVAALAFRESPTAMAVVDLDDGRVILANRACGELLGTGVDQRALWTPADHDRIRVRLAAARVVAEELVVTDPERGERRVRASISAVTVAGRHRALASLVEADDGAATRRRPVTASDPPEEGPSRSWFEAAPALFLTASADRRLLYANRRAADVFGLQPEPGAAPLDPDRAAMAQALERMDDEILAGSELASTEVDVTSPDGDVHTYDVLKFPLRSADGAIWGIVGVGRDISDRRRAADALRESEERFRELAGSLDEVFILWRGQPMEILYMSPSAERVLGLPATTRDFGEVLAKIHPDDQEQMRARFIASLPTRSPVVGDHRFVREDGEVRWIHSRTTHVDGTHERPRRSTILADITEQRAVEEALVAARAEAESANRAKSDFLSKMSHELRTPLNAVLGFGALLQLDPLDARQRDYVEQIVLAGNHLLRLIDEVLDISKIEVGQLRLAVEPVDVDRLIREAVALVGPAAEAACLDLVVGEIPPGMHVLADHLRLRQVLLNLLSNAIKYNRRGGGVRLSAEVTGPRWLRLSVADDGAGLTAQAIAKLFSPFERLGAEASAVPGTGLGLALARELMELMGGEIGVESEPGVGSRFWIELQVAGTTPDVLPPLVSPPVVGPPILHTPGRSGRRAGDARTVLLVEDNASNIMLVEQVLERRPGVILLTARTGRAALRMLEEQRPDLILLDLHLPDTGGAELITAIKSDPRTAAIPVVVVSADATEQQRAVMHELGAADYLTKPLDIPSFLRVIDRDDERTPREVTILYAEDDELNREMMSQLLVRLMPSARLVLAPSGAQAIASAGESTPDLALLDLHLADMTGLDVLAALREQPSTADVAAIILSGDFPPDDFVAEETVEWVTKPYAMPELVNTISRLLARRARH